MKQQNTHTVTAAAAHGPSAQRGSAISHLVLILSLGFALMLIYCGFQTVEPETVTALEARASGTPSAATILAAELKTTPKPTNFEFNSIRRKVNDELVASASRSVVDGAPTHSNTLSKPSEDAGTAEAAAVPGEPTRRTSPEGRKDLELEGSLTEALKLGALFMLSLMLALGVLLLWRGR